MNYGAILSRAWEIIWKHKVLWLFGILASCTSSSYGPNTTNWTVEQRDISPQIEPFFQNLPEWQIWALVIAGIVVVLLIVVLAIFLGTVGRIGLIRGTLQAEEGAEKLTFGELFSGSLPYFWRVFALNLLVGLAITVAFIIAGIFVVLGTLASFGILALCLVPLFCLLIPLSWLVGLILQQANAAIVVEDRGVFNGFERGWQVVRANIGPILVMGLILLVITLLGGFIIGIPIIVIIAPAVTGAIIGTDQALQGGLLVAGICLIFYIPVAIFLNGVLQSYIQSSWALTFLRLTSHSAIVPVEAGPGEPNPVE